MRPTPALFIAACTTLVAPLPPATAQSSVATPALAEPSLSPDGREIAFVSGGDIWTVPSAGGEARLLVAHPANESRPLYAPDGSAIAFVSTRTGNGDVYLLDLRSGAVRRLTFDDGAESPSAWSRDGRWLYFHSSAQDVAGMQDVYRVPAAGGTPMQVAADRYATEFFASPSPDGATLAISARGNASGQWWRNGRSHLDEAELWLVKGGTTPRYERLSEDGGSKDLWPMWSPDGRTVYYMSDRSGAENLWSRPAAGGAATRLTSFEKGRVLWPSLAADGSTIVFERDFALWRYDVASKQARAVAITLRGVGAVRVAERQTLTQVFGSTLGTSLSGDARKLALIGRGELWAVDAREGGDAVRLTATPAIEKQPRWLRGDRALVYVAWSADGGRVMRRDVAEGTTRALTQTGDATLPTPSRDGRLVAYLRDGNALHVMNADGTNDRRVATGSFPRPPFDGGRVLAWSPDNQWVAYLSRGAQGFTNAYVVPVSGGEARAVSFLASSNSGNLEWSPDGTFLLFRTAQRTEPNKLVRIDLVPRTPRFREDRFRDLFAPTPSRDSTRRDAARPDSTVRDVAAREAGRDSSRATTRIVFEGIRQRAAILDPGIEVGSIALSPDGRTLVLTSSGGAQSNLFAWSLDELSREPATPRQITTTAGGKQVVGFSADSREVWYTDAGRVAIVPLAGGASRPVAIAAELETDFHTDKWVAFEQAWATQRDAFYDPAMHGVDWNAVRERFAPYVRAAQTPDELRRLLQLMVGELNASHLGASGPSGFPTVPVGKLGVRFEREAYEQGGGLRVAEVLPLSPAAIAGIVVGDRLTAVDGRAIARDDNLDSLLTNTVGRRLELTVATGSATRRVAVRPIATNAEKGLRYRAWVEERRAYVSKASNGRLGYVHMLDMSAEALDRLYLDLDAENFGREGVVIDVRNNNGGFVNAYALDVFARKGYMTMTTRGSVSAPARTQLGQRSLEKPTVLVVNQHTLSDGEDFTEGYRTLGLGRVVGEPTAGWIVYTSSADLVDGSLLRVPFTRVDGADGKNMELVPRPVDVPVTRPVGESYRGTDSQLDAAVRVLLEKLSR